MLCKFAGTVKIFLKMPSIRMRTTISPSCGSRWMSLARSKNARSMTEFTKRIVGAADALLLSVWFICTGTISGVDVPTSRFISSMARAVPSLPYNVPIACSVARRVEIIGTTRLCEAALISSWRNEVQRVAHGNKELVFYKLYRHHVVLFCDGARHKFGELQWNGDRR